MDVQAVAASNNKFNVQRASAFVNMDDRQVARLAYVQTAQDHKKSESPLGKLFYTIPVVSSLAEGVLQKGSLSAKLSRTAKTGASWGFVLGSFGIYSSVRNAMVAKSSTLQNFKEKHPALALIADVTAAIGTCALTIGLASKMGSKILEKTPKNVAKFEGLISKFKSNIDNSSVNKSFVAALKAGVTDFESKFPSVAQFGRSILRNSVWVMIGGGIAADINSKAKEQKRFENEFKNNISTIRDAQLATAKHLTNVLAVQRDVLAQSSPIASELKEFTEDTKSLDACAVKEKACDCDVDDLD